MKQTTNTKKVVEKLVHLYVFDSGSFSHRESMDELKLNANTLKALSQYKLTETPVLTEGKEMGKAFVFALKNYNDVFRTFRDNQPEMKVIAIPQNTLNALQTILGMRGKEMPNDELIQKFVPKNISSILYDYQKDGVAFALSRGGRVLIADEMGVGKSLQGIALLGAYLSEWPALIICPSSLKGQWLSNCKQWLTPLLSDELKPRCVKKIKDAKDPFDACVNIISYDMAVSKDLELEQKQFKVILLDESHSIKGRDTNRAKILLPHVARAKRIILLSGTPSLSRPAEIFTQVSLLRRDVFSNFHAFGERYCNATRNRFGWSYDGATNLDELNVILETLCMIRRKKDEVLTELPPKSRERVLLSMTPAQLLLVEKSILHLQSVESKKDKVDPITRKAAFMSLWRDVGTAKIPSVIEYINKQLEEDDEKFLVFAHHQNVLDELETFLRKKNVKYIRIDGKTKEEHRTRMVSEFQASYDCNGTDGGEEEESPRVALLSILAVGMGVTLTAANKVIFAELYWTPGALLQAEDRVHRVGQTRPVSIKYLLGEKTSDEKIWWMLEKKFSVLGEMFGQTGNRLGGTKTNFDEELKQTDMQEFITAILGENFLISQTSMDFYFKPKNSTSIATPALVETLVPEVKKRKTKEVINTAPPDDWMKMFTNNE